MASAGLSISQLAERTRTIDPDNRGVAKSTIGHLVATGSSAREHCHPRGAALIARALNGTTTDFFDHNTLP
jgi:hypothetical protein